MLKHIVMWKFKPEAEGADNAAKLVRAKALLDACAGLTPGAYQNHPQHLAVKPFIGAVRLERQCMDYQT